MDATHINILAELFTEVGRWAEAVSLLSRVQTELFRGQPLPADLQVAFLVLFICPSEAESQSSDSQQIACAGRD